MPHSNVTRLRGIKTLPQLAAYLRDELDWPIESDDTDAITFDYSPGELGLDEKSAVAIREIKQLRPLAGNQPWGIFFVSFEKKRLPVVAMRRILRALVFKKRASANKAERQAWHPHDLLFISAYGEETDRAITFAHFVDRPDMALAELRVLGWDDDDTPLHADYVVQMLQEKLRWDSKVAANPKLWRDQWASAFLIRHGHVIRTSEELAEALAVLARRLRGRIRTILRMEAGDGQIRSLQRAFQIGLIHDLDDDGFADMFAQTVTYGLFSVSVRRTFPGIGTAVTKEDVPHLIFTSPFLKDMLGVFLGVKSYKGKIDFDELGVSDVTDLLTSPETHMEVVLADFNNKTRGEDPVIHFYEHFLTAYNKELKVQRGVFYTPQPVVSYIVRSVHELLQTEFGLADGLADISTWGEMRKRNPSLKLPPLTDELKETLTLKPSEIPTISPEEPFVQILDPATGTATFLVEVIDVIHRTLATKWKQQRLTDAQQLTAWNDYVPKHLLPRLHAYELMMAPYAIAHMKVGLKLAETGYQFATEERARIYLTNALEPKVKQLPQIGFDALAHEATAVNEIKWHKRFTVVIGNPPYASISSNLTPELRRIVDPYRSINGERIQERSMLQFEKNIQDDYVKFLAFSQARLRDSGIGLCMLITNHSYLDGPTLRGVRWNLLSQFSQIWLLDLHGNSNKSEEPPNGSANENVFDIKQGVAISACLATLARKAMATRLAECWGTRSEKYQFLNSKTLGTTSFCDLEPKAPNFYFVVPDTGKCAKEWDAWPSVAEIFTKRSTGTESGFDDLLVAFTRPELEARIHRFSDSGVSRIDLAKEFAFSEGHASELFDRRREMTTASSKEFRPFQLRAYDYRCAFLRKELLKTNSFNVMLDLSTETPGLVTTRQTKESFTAFAVSSFCGHKVTSSYDRSYVFPLFTTDHGSLMPTKVPCISRKALLQLKHLSHNASDIQLATDAFHYALAVMNAPAYRTLFCSQLKRDFPRLPMTGNLVLFRALARIGGELTALHLMKSPKLDSSITEFFGNRNIEVEKVSWSENTVWIDKARTTGFNGVREGVWHFCVGGYQVCEKWLKDRKGRRLSSEDRAHYQKIVVALSETIRLMAEIDAVIDEHGGWPAAFVVSSASSSKDKAMGNGEAIPQAAEDPASYSSGKTGDLGIVTDDELPLR